ncbi:MAG: tRNA 2-thiouridine(34) synthase MnmA [bacterium]|nr:tRNA 2-thiouridine(34) synthase MnmA [bacterium]
MSKNEIKLTETVPKRKVYVGMSGGVDSSVAAYLLKQATPNNFEKLFGRPTPKGFSGYDVVGVYLMCYSGPVKEQSSHGASDEEVCNAKKDMEDARAVAYKLGIPFYVWNLEKEYKEKVIDYMVEGYRAGITPNPDVMCNREIKFGIFLNRALAMGADYVATGHYVRKLIADSEIADSKNFGMVSSKLKAKSYKLFSARDAQKDQSYFLWTLTQEQLKHCLFPIGDYLKSEVREIARTAGLITADKKDSQGVCFVGKIKLEDFLSEAIISRRGEVITSTGEKIGEHNGSEFYTIGQRHLGISNMGYGTLNKGKDTKPYYVAAKDVKANTLMVVEGDNDSALYKKEIKLSNVNFISSNQILDSKFQIQIMARVRYRQPLVSATLYQLQPTTNNQQPTTYKLIFDKPVKFVAPGQSAVFYSRNPSTSSGSKSEDFEMLGGGVIL